MKHSEGVSTATRRSSSPPDTGHDHPHIVVEHRPIRGVPGVHLREEKTCEPTVGGEHPQGGHQFVNREPPRLTVRIRHVRQRHLVVRQHVHIDVHDESLAATHDGLDRGRCRLRIDVDTPRRDPDNPQLLKQCQFQVAPVLRKGVCVRDEMLRTQ